MALTGAWPGGNGPSSSSSTGCHCIGGRERASGLDPGADEAFLVGDDLPLDTPDARADTGARQGIALEPLDRVDEVAPRRVSAPALSTPVASSTRP